MVSIMRAMNVDLVKTVKIVAEVYGESHLPVTELARYWATARELRDLVLEELWKMDGDPVPRNEELIEAVKNTLQVPLCPKTGKVAEVIFCVFVLFFGRESLGVFERACTSPHISFHT